MKKHFFILPLLAFLCQSCLLTSILTYVPDPQPVVVAKQPVVVASQPVKVVQPVATTTVYSNKTTTTVKVMSTDKWDISYYLDLNAIGAAFAQSNNVQEFEMLINNSQYMLTNLDLNGDGWVDYIRVMETYMGQTHILLLQAVLAANYFQDVATIVVECVPSRQYVQVIGAPYIYGTNYIIEPVFIKTPPMYAYWNNRPHYVSYSSPYYWEHYPTCYKRPQPVYISHYQAYVTTYMQGHAYCHEAKPAPKPRYQDYARMAQPLQRNDYATQHPERAFSTRTGSAVRENPVSTQSTAATRQPIVNARDLQKPHTETTVAQQEKTRAAQPAQSVRTQRASTATASSASTQSVRTQVSAPTGQLTSSKTAQPSTTRQPVVQSSSRTTAPATSTSIPQRATPSTTTQTRMNANGSTSTRTTRVASDGTTTVRTSRAATSR